jgi:hypothetical protein
VNFEVNIWAKLHRWAQGVQSVGGDTVPARAGLTKTKVARQVLERAKAEGRLDKYRWVEVDVSKDDEDDWESVIQESV